MLYELSRRRFLAIFAVACTAAASRPRGAIAAEDKPWGGFPLGVQTISLRKYPLPEVMRHLQGMGVHHVELSASTHLRSTAGDEQLLEVKQLAEKAGLKITAQGVNRFSKDHDANRKIFEFAKKLGICTITANPDRDAETFASLNKLVSEYNLRIAIHNHGPGALYDKLEDVASAVKGHDRRIGACVDCGHFLSSGEDPVRCLAALSDRVFGVHLKDQAEVGQKSPNVVIGRGHLDVVSLFRALRQIRFPADGALSLEYEASPDNPIDDLKACLAVVKDAIAKLG